MKFLVRLLLVICFTGAVAQQKKSLGSTVWLTSEEQSAKGLPEKASVRSFNYNDPVGFHKQREYLKKKINFSKSFTLFLVYRDTSGIADHSILELTRGTTKVAIKSNEIITHNQVELNKGNVKDGFLLTVFNTTSEVKKAKNCAIIFNEAFGNEASGPQVFEMIYFPRVLSRLERAKTESYLSLKYGISLKDSDYFNSKGEKIWTLKNNEGYVSRVTGISRDDMYALDQKQSGNYQNDGLHIGLTAIASKNNRNTTETTNMDYLIWSDNNKPAVFGKATSSESFAVFNRVWKVNSKMTKQQVFSLVFDKEKMSSLKENTLPYWLVQYTDNSGIDFSKAKLIRPIINNQQQLVFDKIVFENTNASYFTIVRAPEFFADMTVDKAFCDAQGKSSVKLDMVGGVTPYRIKITATDYNKVIETNERSMVVDNLADGQYDVIIESGSNVYQSQFTIDSFSDNAIAMEKEYFLSDEPLEITPKIASAEEIVSYQWYHDAKVVSTEATLKTDEEGNYKLVIQNKKGCIKESLFAVRNSVVTATGWSIYPNPVDAGQHFKVQFSFNEKKKVGVLIHDLNGKLIKNISLGTTANHTYVDTLSKSGTYLVTVVIDGKESAYKLIVK